MDYDEKRIYANRVKRHNFNDCLIEYLIFLYKNQTNQILYSSYIAKKINMTLSHTLKVTNTLEKKGFIIKEPKNKRTKKISLTEKGIKVTKLFIELDKLINE